MTEKAAFRLELSGDTADHHEFQGYDGYRSLAGFAWTLSLAANYAETGSIRLRGDFPGRNAVRAQFPKRGSIVADFAVHLQQNPVEVLGFTGIVTAAGAATFLVDLTRRLIARNIGKESVPDTELMRRLLQEKEGEIEALVARTEPSVRQAHAAIGNGAKKIRALGGFNLLGEFDKDTKEYVMTNVEDDSFIKKDVSVAAFNANSGYGSVFDFDLGRVIPISIRRSSLPRLRPVFTWGLDQYANGTKKLITIEFSRILAMDETPKRYTIVDAYITKGER